MSRFCWSATEASLSGPVEGDRCNWGKADEWNVNKIVNNFRYMVTAR